MSWNGKLLGGALGFAAFGGPWGAVLGAVLGHQYDAHVERRGGLRAQRLFLPATFRVMGHVAKADGRVSEQEIAAARSLMQALRLDQSQTVAAIAHYTEGKQPDFQLEPLLRELRGAVAPHPQLARFFIDLQLQVAMAGNGLVAGSRQRLQLAARLLGLSGADFERMEQLIRARGGYGSAGSGGDRNRDQRIAEACALLEIKVDASNEQLTRAYRRMMSRHHPDKLQSQGLPEAMLERAKERTQQIQAAYQLLREVRGMR